jgi:HTH-type transcriptional regulator/antitoxin HigA
VSPIRSDADLAAALAEIDKLLDPQPAALSKEGSRLEILSELVHAYEERHHPIPPPEPLDAIRFRMEQQGLKDADVVKILGSRSHGYEVLRGKRPLTLTMIRRLHEKLKIPFASLIGRGERSSGLARS